VSAVAESLGSMELSSTSSSGSTQHQRHNHSLHRHAHNKAPWQPLAAYKMEPDLARYAGKGGLWVVAELALQFYTIYRLQKMTTCSGGSEPM
jgi:hypothetical protein